jgi:hypothetical protein
VPSTGLTSVNLLLGFARVNVLVSSLVSRFAAVLSLVCFGVREVSFLAWTGLTGVGAFMWKSSSPICPDETGLTGESDQSDRCWSGADRVALSVAFSSRFRWLLAPRTSSTAVATWSWPTWVVESETCFGLSCSSCWSSHLFREDFFFENTSRSAAIYEENQSLQEL